MSQDTFPISGWDYIHLYVGNAKQAAFFYNQAFGLDIVAYSGLETGNREYTSYVLQSNKIRFVLSTAQHPDHPMAEFVKQHGDGVHDVAFAVPDASKAYDMATSRGAKGVLEPMTMDDEFGKIKIAQIALYGDVVHSFVERQDYAGPFMPGYRKAVENAWPKHPFKGLLTIDHIVGNVELGRMNEIVKFYEDILGFRQIIHFTDKNISTEYSALMSKVMEGGKGNIKLPINEPAPGLRKSQIEEYLEFNHGPGVQHIALLTGDIIETVAHLRKSGVEFLSAIPSYYANIEERVGHIEENMSEIARLGILVDRDEEGYLLQIFSKPMQDRPTLFIEIIQRKGARGFGEGNFKALFEAIEREQALRGNL